MSRIKFLFTLSILANLGFAAALLLKFPGFGAGDHAMAPVAAAVARQTDAPKKENRIGDSQPAATPLQWSDLTSAPIETFVATLRAAGWPEMTVRRLTREEIDRRNPPYSTEAARATEDFKFWNCGELDNPWAGNLTELDAATRQQRREANEAEFRNLFGDNPWSTEEDVEIARWNEQRRWGNLSADKRAAVEKILSDGQAMAQKIFNEIEGPLLPGDREILGMIESEVQADIAATLTPEEYLEYRLRNSNTANRMRAELGRFQPSREEFLAIFEIREAFDHQFERRWQDVPRTDPARQAARAEMEAAIHRTLGDARYADYRRATDPAFARLEALARRSDASEETIAELYDLAQAAQEKPGVLPAVKETFARAIGAEATMEFFRTRG